MSLLDVLCSLNPDVLGTVEIKDIFSNIEYYNSFEKVDHELKFFDSEYIGTTATIILFKDKVYMYADAILGATDDAAILFLKDPANSNIYNLIKRDTYPELIGGKNNKKD